MCTLHRHAYSLFHQKTTESVLQLQKHPSLFFQLSPPHPGAVQPSSAEPAESQPVWLHLRLEQRPSDGELCLSCYLAVAAGREMGRIFSPPPLLLTLEVTRRKETFITLTCGCCGEKRRWCVRMCTVLIHQTKHFRGPSSNKAETEVMDNVFTSLFRVILLLIGS